jgi:hypothetical protein
MNSASYLRLAVSKDKEWVLHLSPKGIVIQELEDTYTLEFFVLPEKKRYICF